MKMLNILLVNLAIFFELQVDGQNASLFINEVNPNLTGSRDLIELLVTSGGNVEGIVIQQGITTPTELAVMPAVNVELGDIIVVHLNPSTLNGDAAASETLSKNQYSDPANYASAWDFLGGTNGITFTNRILIMKTQAGAILDAVAFTNNGNLPSTFPDDLQSIQNISEWLPGSCGGSPCTYLSSPVAQSVCVDWSSVSNNLTGNSMQRNSTTDSNIKTDWSLSVSTFGTINTGQVITGIIESPTEHIYLLKQNFPNPSFSVTTIEYYIPKRCNVILKVIDLTGKEVETLVDRIEDPGDKSVTFDTSALITGIYFYELHTGNYSEIRKIYIIN